MAASSNQKHAHFIPFKPKPKTLVIQIYKKDSTEQIHTSDKNVANTLFLLFTVLSLLLHSQSYNSVNSEPLFFFAHNSIDFK